MSYLTSGKSTTDDSDVHDSSFRTDEKRFSQYGSNRQSLSNLHERNGSKISSSRRTAGYDPSSSSVFMQGSRFVFSLFLSLSLCPSVRQSLFIYVVHFYCLICILIISL